MAQPQTSIKRRTAIFAAMPWECRPVLRQLRQVRRERRGQIVVWRGQAGRGEVTVVKTGIGPEQAEAAARAILPGGNFDVAVSTGCAGGLISGMRAGDIVVASIAVCEPSRETFPVDTGLGDEILAVATRRRADIRRGSLLCVREPLLTPAAKGRAAAHGHVAVEMEGAAIARQARLAAVPFAAIRSILDAVDVELEKDSGIVDSHSGDVKPLALARYLATRPNAIPKLLEMRSLARAAERSLEGFFADWLR